MPRQLNKRYSRFPEVYTLCQRLKRSLAKVFLCEVLKNVFYCFINQNLYRQ
jgi:hypothetical protein